MLFDFVRSLLILTCYVFWLVSFCLIFWPVPIFILSNPNNYINFIFNIDITKDHGAGGVLPFLWGFFTLPLGLGLLTFSFTGYFLIKKYI